jgi:hypothetical protein
MKLHLKAAIKRRLLNFETFNGAFIYLPWGAGFIYCGLFDLKAGYVYGMLSVGAALIVWGLRKISVDPVKFAATLQKQVEELYADKAPAPTDHD